MYRLSTIRNADVINVIVGGEVVESGSHDELMSRQTYYKKLVEKQEGVEDNNELDSTPASSRVSSAADLQTLEIDNAVQNNGQHLQQVPHIQFKDVHFVYPTRPKKNIFNGLNLTIFQGETIALVGKLIC